MILSKVIQVGSNTSYNISKKAFSNIIKIQEFILEKISIKI